MIKAFLLSILSVGFLATNSFAALTVPSSLDTADFMSVAGIVIVAMAAIWSVKKALQLIRG